MNIDEAKCDKCHGDPGVDLGGCFRCGGSGLAKDHQPDITPKHMKDCACDELGLDPVCYQQERLDT